MSITLADIDDELLKPITTQDDIDYANERLEEEAERLGMQVNDPMKRKVKDLGIAFAMFKVADRKTGAAAHRRPSDGEVFDLYANKRRYCEKTIDKITSNLQAADFEARGNAATNTGEQPNSIYSIPIGRD